MKQSIEDVTEREFAPVTTIVAKATDKYLQERGVDWREAGKKMAKR